MITTPRKLVGFEQLVQRVTPGFAAVMMKDNRPKIKLASPAGR
jgi:hypothetical protein